MPRFIEDDQEKRPPQRHAKKADAADGARFYGDPAPDANPAPAQPPRRGADPFYILMVVLIVAVAALTASVVALLAGSARYAAQSSGSTVSEVRSMPESESGRGESSGSGSADSSSRWASDSSAASSSAESDRASSAHGTPSLDEAAATAAFEQNSVDRKKTAALQTAHTTTAMLQVYDTALSGWKTAINAMNNELRRCGEATDDEQTKWEQEVSRRTAAREEELRAGGGSLAKNQLAEYRDQQYRDRALALFLRLRRYDADYMF